MPGSCGPDQRPRINDMNTRIFYIGGGQIKERSKYLDEKVRAAVADRICMQLEATKTV